MVSQQPVVAAGDREVSSLVSECMAALERLAAGAKPPESEWLDLDMTMGQLKAMLVLTGQGSTTVGCLGRRLGIAEPSASLLADKLEERGLAQRMTDPTDRRRTLVAATEAGRQLIGRLQRVRDERMTEWLTRLSADDLHALLRGLNALTAALSGDVATPVDPCQTPAAARAER